MVRAEKDTRPESSSNPESVSEALPSFRESSGRMSALLNIYTGSAFPEKAVRGQNAGRDDHPAKRNRDRRPGCFLEY